MIPLTHYHNMRSELDVPNPPKNLLQNMAPTHYKCRLGQKHKFLNLHQKNLQGQELEIIHQYHVEVQIHKTQLKPWREYNFSEKFLL